MSKSFRKSVATAAIDQHFGDGPYVTFDRFDAVEMARRLADSGIDGNYIATKCVYGYYYYDTDVGIKHPGLGSRDQVAELVGACRDAGIETVAYTVVRFNNVEVRLHPDWSMIGHDRRPRVFRRDHRWNMACINTMYRQHFLRHVKEVLEKYPFDSLFLDSFGHFYWWDVIVCYCDACDHEYQARGIDVRSADPRERGQVLAYWHENWAGFLDEVIRVAKAARPGVAVSFNALAGPFRSGGASLVQADWVYSEGGEDAFNPIGIRNVAAAGPQCGIGFGKSGRPYDVWPEARMRVMAGTVVAHGSRTLFFFLSGLEPDGSFADDKYELLRNINRETREKWPWVEDSHPVTATAVIHHEKTKLARIAERRTSASPEQAVAEDARELTSEGSIIDTLRRLSVPCEVVPDWRLSDEELARYQLVILPEIWCLSDGEAATFRRFVERGGNLLVWGRTGLRDSKNEDREDFALADVMGIHYSGECRDYDVPWPTTSGYLRPPAEAHPIFGALPQRELEMPGQRFLQVKPETAEVVAYIAEPVGRESASQFIGWPPLPPSATARWPGVTVNRWGGGRCVYVAASLNEYLKAGRLVWPSRLIEGVVNFLDVDPGVQVEGPKGLLEATYFLQESEGRRRLIVHLLNQSIHRTEGNIISLRDIKILIDKQHFPCDTVRIVYPADSSACKVTGHASQLEIDVPEVSLHVIVAVDVGIAVDLQRTDTQPFSTANERTAT